MIRKLIKLLLLEKLYLGAGMGLFYFCWIVLDHFTAMLSVNAASNFGFGVLPGKMLFVSMDC